VNLILVDSSEVSPDGTVTLRDERGRHLRRVLDVAPADAVRVGLIDGGIGVGTVTDVDAAGVTLRCAFGDVPARPRVDLLLALPRPKVMRRLWAQLSAIGVGRIMLSNAARVERNYFDTHVLSPECYRPLLLEGLQQARDTRVPLVTIHRQFRKLIEDELASLSDVTTRIVADPGTTTSIRDAAKGTSGSESGQASSGPPNDRVLLAVGPEGGWNDFELALLEAHAFRRAGIGARTLRSDTACIALLAVLTESITGNGES
jgi:16S rRNA (uracil1498-N3)-methyltransferase